MKLPGDVSAMILQGLAMPGLNHKTKFRYAPRLNKLRKQMMKLSDDFASNTSTESRNSDAYFAYNFPMNLMKTMTIVQQMKTWYRNFFVDKRHYSILDIGCGEGAGMLGFYYSFRDHEDIRAFDLVGIDGSRKMLQRAKDLTARIRRKDRRLKVRLSNQRIDSTYRCESKGRYDIILLLNSLAEIIRGEVIPTQFIKAVARCMADDGMIVIIEPALKRLARRIMRLHNALNKQKTLRVLLPCLHDNDCALLQVKNRNEWCHQSISWWPPDFLKIINQGLNREIDRLKFTYLVIVKSGSRLIRPKGYLAISQLLKEKGRKRCYLCTPKGRIELVRLNRARTDGNKSFDDIMKGSVLEVKDATIMKSGYWQVTGKTRISIVDQESP